MMARRIAYAHWSRNMPSPPWAVCPACLFLLIGGLFVSPYRCPAAGQKDKIGVVVSILPQAHFVEKIGGEHVAVDVLVGPGQSPATYEPTPKEMAALSEARVYFRIGVPFEDSLLPKIRRLFEEIRVVDLRENIKMITMTHSHAHGEADKARPTDAPEASESKGNADPHIWLDPQRVKVMCMTICEELCRLDPAHRTAFERNRKTFAKELDAVDARIRKNLAPFKGRAFYVFHPSYGYFADRYGLRQVAVEAGGKEPSARELASLIDRARRDEVKVIFVQPQFSQKAANAVASAIDGSVVRLDPLARDYLRNLEEIAGKIASALGPTQ